MSATQLPMGTRPMALGDLIRWRRKQLGLSQEEIAARDPAGKMKQGEISQYENYSVGRSRKPKMERLALALGLPYDLVAASTYQPIAEDNDVAEFVRRWFAANDAAQLPLSASTTPHQRMIADLLAQAQSDPDLLRLIRQLSEENTEETYRRTIQIVWRHFVAGLETARDLLPTNPPDTQRV